MSDKIVKNWLALAEYDIKTAKSMMKSKRYLYVTFTCHQAIEKLLKALYVREKNETPPYTHNLLKLFKSSTIILDDNESKLEFMEYLNSFYIESRYTEEINELTKLLNQKKASEILKKSKDLFLWLKTKI